MSDRDHSRDVTQSAVVTFFAAGRPKTKGSLKFVPSAQGGGAIPKQDPKKVAWQGVVAYAAHKAGLRRLPAVDVSLEFVFARPKGHYGTGRNADVLKATAPNLPTSHSVGDVDKLARAVLDGLTGVAFDDDAEVCELRVRKVYAVERDEPEGVHVTVRPVRNGGDL